MSLWSSQMVEIDFEFVKGEKSEGGRVNVSVFMLQNIIMWMIHPMILETRYERDPNVMDLTHSKLDMLYHTTKK